MKILINNIIKTLIFLLIATGFVSCSDDDEVNQDIFINTADVVLRDRLGTDVTLYKNAWEKSGLSDRLTGTEEFTYLVLTDNAMQVALQANGVNSISEASVSVLVDILERHTFSGLITSSDLSKTSVTNIIGEIIYVSVGGDVVFNGDATVIQADDLANNAVFHKINFPLLEVPTTTIAGLVSSIATSQDTLVTEFTTLLAALEASGLDQALADAGNEFTVFAPTDAAFELNGFTADNIGSALSQDDLVRLLSYHVFAERSFTIDLEDGRLFTINGNADVGEQGLDFVVTPDQISIDGLYEVTTESVNVLATNGTVQIVNDILLPRPFLTDAVEFNSLGFVNLSPLVGNSTETDYVSAFANALSTTTLDVEGLFETEEEHTMFIPRFVDANSSANAIVGGHTFEGKFSLSDTVGSKIVSLNGAEYYVTEGADGNIWLNGRERIAQVLDFFNFPTDDRALIEEFNAYNGFISLFVNELVPLPDLSVSVELGEDTANEYDLFRGALDFLQLGELSDVTYLAVPDSLFAEAYVESGIDAVVDSLGTGDFDAEELTEIINKHIITTVVFSVDLEGGAQYTDRNGDAIDIVNATVTVKDMNDEDVEVATFGILQNNNEGDVSTVVVDISNLDNLGSNGVYHGILGLLE